jgi:hypothetical protein
MANSEFIEAWIERLRIEPRRKATEVAEKLKNYCHSEPVSAGAESAFCAGNAEAIVRRNHN